MSDNQKLLLLCLSIFILGTCWGWHLREQSKNPGIAVTKWVFQTTTGLSKLIK